MGFFYFIHLRTYQNTKCACLDAQIDTCTYEGAKRAAKYLLAPWLPYGHLYDCTARHTVQSNRAHQETSDSLYHRCFYFTLIQNKHTWRSTNRCTQAHTQSTSDPEPTQNSSRHFSRLAERERELCRPPETAGRMVTWQNGVKVIAIGLT